MPLAKHQNVEWIKKYGPWAMVTGATDGIGRAIAFALAARGLNIVLVARRAEKLAKVAQEIEKSYGTSTQFITADLGDANEVLRVLKQTKELDVGLLVATAGFGTAGPFLDIAAEDEIEMLAVNCQAVLILTKEMAGRLAHRKSGGIMLFSSIVAFQGVPYSANYAATKAYIQTLAEGLHRELKPNGIDVLSVAPGPVNTGFAARSKMQMGRAANADDVAQAAVNALGYKTTISPGLLAKILRGSLSLLPRFGRSFIMGQIMAGMTKIQNGSKP